MIQRASYVGEIAARILALKGKGEVTRVFPNSVYVESRGEYLLILWSGQKSPMTVNVMRGNAARSFGVGAKCKLSERGIDFGNVVVDIRKAKVYHSLLSEEREENFPTPESLVKGVALLKLLYGVSSGPTLDGDPALRMFAKGILYPISEGESGPAYTFENYVGLIGRGLGFTPAGDDFVAGFLATFNYIARLRRWRRILVLRYLVARTIPESAAIILYSSRCQVDEGLGRLITVVSSAGGRGLYDALLRLAHRGHTSGIDMSLGVLLCVAALSDAPGQRKALELCLDTLWKP
jgi:hypothetical protein